MKYPAKVVDVCQFLENKGAEDICVCNMQNRNVVDYIILSSLQSTTHIQEVKDFILSECAKLPLVYGDIRVEGFTISDWVVLDMDDVFVHLITRDERSRYNIDKFLNDGGNMVSLKKLKQDILAEENKKRLMEEHEDKVRQKAHEKLVKKREK